MTVTANNQIDVIMIRATLVVKKYLNEWHMARYLECKQNHPLYSKQKPKHDHHSTDQCYSFFTVEMKKMKINKFKLN